MTLTLPILKGEHYLSGEATLEIISITGKAPGQPIIGESPKGDLYNFCQDGGYYTNGQKSDADLRIRTVPGPCRDNTPFGGLVYRHWFAARLADGRMFEQQSGTGWIPFWGGPQDFVPEAAYRLVPLPDQYRDAVDRLAGVLDRGRTVARTGEATMTDQQELEALRGWKQSAMTVLAGWERVFEAAGSPGPLGGSKSNAVLAVLAGLPSRADVEAVLAPLRGPKEEFRRDVTDVSRLMRSVCRYADHIAAKQKRPAWSVVGDITDHGSGVASAIYELYRDKPNG
jgi:hypothetical protein